MKSNLQSQDGNTPSLRPPRWLIPVICLVLAAITFAVFGQTVRHEFINFDDNAYVYENPEVARGLTVRGFVWAFTSIRASNWHPLTWLSHMLDCQIYGLHPGGHHLTNVLLHTAMVILLFLVLRQMTGALWRSAFVAAVFAIHPLRVESVAWVAERKDILSGLFFVLTIGAYVRFARHRWSPGRYGLVVLLLALGLMCKPMLVTLPLVLLLLDYWPLKRVESARRLVMEKVPLLVLCVASSATTLLAQSGAISADGLISLPHRLGNAVTACVVYLGQMVWPAGLAVFYPYPSAGLPSWEVGLAVVLLACVSAAAIWQRGKQPWVMVGWFWYLAMLVPVVGIIQVGGQAHADRYTYLPQIGIYVALTWVVAEWRLNRFAVGGLMAGVVAVLMVCAWRQTGYWQNSEVLWIRDLACTTESSLAHNNLGSVVQQKGKVDEAITQYRMALQINPRDPQVHNNLGFALRQKGKLDEAVSHYRTALQIRPRNAQALNNLGVALRQQGKLDEAISQYEMALKINPNAAPIHKNLGITLMQRGRVDEAIIQYQTALEISPEDPPARVELGAGLMRKGRVDEAITQYRTALQIRPDYADAHDNLGTALLQKGRTTEALGHYQEALRIQPANAKVQNNVAWVLATSADASLRNGAKAVELAQQANKVSGGTDPGILDTLAAALAETGKFSEATLTAQKAMELARAAGQKDLVEELNSELKRYQAGLSCCQ